MEPEPTSSPDALPPRHNHRLKIIYLLNLGNIATLMLVQIVMVPFYLKYLGVHAYEQWTFISSIGFICQALDFGLVNYSSNAVRLAYGRADGVEAERLAGHGLSFFTLLFSFFSLLALLVYAYDHSETKVVLALVLLNVPLSQFRTWLAGLFTARVGQIGELLLFISVTLAQALAYALVVIGGGGLEALALAQILVMLLFGWVPVFWAIYRFAPEFRLRPSWVVRGQRRAFMAGCLANFSYTAASTAVVYFPVILLGLIPGLPAGCLAIFTTSRTLTGIVRQFCQQMARSNLIEISRYLAPEHHAQMRRLFLMGAAVISVLAALGMGALWPMADVVFTLWTKKPELYDPTVIGLFCVSAVLTAQFQLPMFLPQFTNRAGVMVRPLFLQIVLLVILGLPGGYFFGAAGMVVANTLAEVCTLGGVAFRRIIPETGVSVAQFIKVASLPGLIVFMVSSAVSLAGKYIVQPQTFGGLVLVGVFWSVLVLPFLALLYRQGKHLLNA